LRLLDFESAPEACRLTINDWVRDQTEGRITDLLAPDTVDTSTRLVLTNVIYFNASWEEPFKPDRTKRRIFHLLDGRRVRVPMMTATEYRNYLIGEGYRGVELRYVGREMSMVIVMPDSGNFEAFENSLDAQHMESLLAELTWGTVTLTMPRFRFDSDFRLEGALSSMGMPQVFSLAGADFCGMTGYPELFVDHMVHKTFVSVDEAGTEAAVAAGGIMPPALNEPVEITLDRPFVFLIRDMKTGTILFIGRVVNPSAREGVQLPNTVTIDYGLLRNTSGT
jgi:serpin B